MQPSLFDETDEPIENSKADILDKMKQLKKKETNTKTKQNVFFSNTTLPTLKN